MRLLSSSSSQSSENAGLESQSKTLARSRQQWLLISLLALVLAGVGFWQWNNMQTPPPPPQPPNSQGAKPQPAQNEQGEAGSPESVRYTTLPSFLPRDPFRPDLDLLSQQSSEAEGEEKPKITGGKTRPFSVPPLPPLSLNMSSEGLEKGQEPKPVEPEPLPKPEWSLVGIVEGPQTLAILKDSEGNRRFVRVNENLEPGFRVLAIQRGAIILKGHGQSFTLRLGDTPHPPSEPSNASSNH